MGCYVLGSICLATQIFELFFVYESNCVFNVLEMVLDIHFQLHPNNLLLGFDFDLL